MNVLTTVVKRWKAKSPPFFIGLKKVAMTVGGSAVAVFVANTTMNLELPEMIITVCKYTIAIAIGITGTSKLTQDSPSNPK